MINSLAQEIKSKVEALLKEQGIELVEFKIFQASRRQIVRCLIDYPDGGITIDRCAMTNKQIFVFLSEKNLLGDNFSVEVNSPGLDRRLKTSADFARARGRIISLWFNQAFEDKEYLEGEVLDVNDNNLFLKDKNQDVIKISIDQVRVGKEKLDT